MGDPQTIADYMDERVCCRVDAGEDLATPAGVSEDLLSALSTVGLGGRTVLDVGCGAGGLCLELLERGATRAVGIDLSPEAIRQARLATRGRGLASRVQFAVGDGAATPLDPADVVVLDKVYCCFFDPDALLRNTLPAASAVYAIVLPPSEGFRGRLARLVIGAENLWRRLKRNDFRAYVHDVPALEAEILDAGFRPSIVQRRPLWDVRIYVRDGA
ncbi:MAG: class I SAM-dependent methyltransferase [Nitriliruptorales bacterium]|nr:class I SAM-dependent methyltransferase [Nitriliruptorales bacterium]